LQDGFQVRLPLPRVRRGPGDAPCQVLGPRGPEGPSRGMAGDKSGRTPRPWGEEAEDRKSTRLNSSHEWISYAVFCLKKKKTGKPDNDTDRDEKKRCHEAGGGECLEARHVHSRRSQAERTERENRRPF